VRQRVSERERERREEKRGGWGDRYVRHFAANLTELPAIRPLSIQVLFYIYI
jgi:hypothetical protein